MLQRLLIIIVVLTLVACGGGPLAEETTEVILSPATAWPDSAGQVWPMPDWASSAPEQQGLDPAGLEALRQAIDEQDLGLDSILVIRNGVIVGEYYYGGEKASTLHDLWSVTKSFASTLVGIAIDQGLIEGVDQPLAELLPEVSDVSEVGDALTLEHVLTMNTGLAWDDKGDINSLYRTHDWPEYVLSRAMTAEPGTRFNYCSGCSHLLTSVLDQAGVDVEKFAVEKLFEPLGIGRYIWENDPQGVPIGGWGLRMTPRDMARLGYLFLRQGRWGDSQVVSAEWVAQATSRHNDTDGDLGYGYQWWTLPGGKAYAALGRDGQTIYVHPGLDLVVVTTAHGVDHSKIFELINSYLLPAVR